MTKHFEEIVQVTKRENEVLQEVLDIEEGCSEDYSKEGVIQTFSCVFETPYGKYGADIEVCNADTPYVNPVLFKIIEENNVNNWFEVQALEVEDTLLGSYEFEQEIEGETITFEAILELEE